MIGGEGLRLFRLSHRLGHVCGKELCLLEFHPGLEIIRGKETARVLFLKG